MVVFIDGEPDFDSYRRFKIKTFEGADDYRAHQEMMTRRLERLTTDAEKFPKPDLIIIDGGKGQLSSVKEIFDKYQINDIDLIALAEKNEEIYTLDSNVPVILEKRDYCLKMLQRIRDEAHRFAITYHRTLRGKRALTSVLDGVKGLGKVKKRALLDKFKDLAGIIKADKTELMGVEGIGEVQAENIIATLTKEGLR
jgi:excinuclease ABC subunit C